MLLLRMLMLKLLLLLMMMMMMMMMMVLLLMKNVPPAAGAPRPFQRQTLVEQQRGCVPARWGWCALLLRPRRGERWLQRRVGALPA
jgi:hypothetical protein